MAEEIEYVVPGPDGERIKRTARIEHVDSSGPKTECRTVQIRRAKSEGPTDVRSLMQRAREESHTKDE